MAKAPRARVSSWDLICGEHYGQRPSDSAALKGRTDGSTDQHCITVQKSLEPQLIVRRVMRQQFAVLHKMLLDTVRHDPICRRLMTTPGVGAVVAGKSLSETVIDALIPTLIQNCAR